MMRMSRANIFKIFEVLLPKSGSLVIIICCLLMVPRLASATSLLYQNLDDLVSKSEGIVIGTVQKTEVHRGPDNKIYTFITLSDLDVIHGTYFQDKLILQQLGGVMSDNDGMIVVGAPTFSVSDRLLVFLRGNGTNFIPIVGWTQGVFKVKHDTANNEDVITDHDGNRILGLKGNDLNKENKYNNANADIVKRGESILGPAGISPSVNGDSTPSLKDSNTATDSLRITKQEFIEIIRKKINEKRKPDVPIVSVDIPIFATEKSTH